MKRPTGIAILSCVGGGPMQRLVDAYGDRSQVIDEYPAERWRELMSSGRLGRLRARVGAMVRFPLRSVRALARTAPGTVAVPTTNPFFLPFVVLATRALHGRPVVPLVYDLYPDALEAGGARAARTTAWAARWMNRRWFRSAEGVAFIGAKMADHARGCYGEPRTWMVAETGADAGEFSDTRVGPPAAASELERWCEGRVVLSYVGNLGHVHDWATLGEVIPRLAARTDLRQHWGIVVAASGPGVEYLRQRWADISPSVVRFEAPLSDLAWARLLVRTDVALVTLKQSAHRTSIPSKTFSAMAAGSAILAVAPRDSDLGEVITRHGCGAIIEPGDVSSTEATLADWLTRPAHLRSMRDAALDSARNHYDLRVLAERWRTFLAAPTPAGATYERLKRGLDIAGSALALGALAPVIGLSAAAVKVSMGSPVIFRQERPGKHGIPFRLAKLRTMRSARPGEEGPEHDAARLGRLGRFLRATSIDELPTLWNVLRGDMSLVGPRPLLMRYLPRYSPEQARRHDVRPGVTGWAQVNGRNALGWDEKFALDVWYVDHRALWLDLYIMFATVLKVLKRDGISQTGHATMPEFRGVETNTGNEVSGVG